MPHDKLDEIESLLTPPARRNVNEMKLQISELALGARAGATFVSPIFGVYVVWGAMSRAQTMVTSSSASTRSSRKASPPTMFSAAPRRVDQSLLPDLRRSRRVWTTALHVRATFINGASFVNVLGPAVMATAAPIIGVGAWVLAYKGKPGVNLKAVDVLAAPGEVGLTCPPAGRSWHDATTDSAT
jgi:hypothetical protein